MQTDTMTAIRGASNRGGAQAEQRQRAAVTRIALIAAARGLFSERGYHATSTPDVAACAALTRGALYHHFSDKSELFAAVFSEVLAELNQVARGPAASQSSDTWTRIIDACTTYLSLIACSPGYQRILLIDGPAVLGWSRWRDLQSVHVATGIADALRALMRRGIVGDRPPEPLAYLLQAALSDAALAIAHAADTRSASTDATGAFISLLEGLRIRPDASPSGLTPPKEG